MSRRPITSAEKHTERESKNRKIKRLKKKVRELEKEIEKLKGGVE